MLADPTSRDIVAHWGAAPRALGNSAVAQTLVARYGADLAARLDNYSRAVEGLRGAYGQAMQQAARAGAGPGWVTKTTVTQSGSESNEVSQTVFDPNAFHAHWAQGTGLAQRAVAALWGTPQWQPSGGMHNGNRPVQWDSWSSAIGGLRIATSDASSIYIPGTLWSSTPSAAGGLVRIDPNKPPKLHDAKAVGFDPVAGFVTHQSNFVREEDWLDKAFPVIVGVVAVWATGGLAASAGTSVAGAAGGSAVAGAAVSAGISAAAFSAASQLAANGRIDFKQLLRTTLSGAVTGGVLNGLGVSAQQLQGAPFATRVLGLTGAATVQGALQEVLGGQFKDGFTSAIASGLASEIGSALNSHIAGLKGLSVAEQTAFKLLAQATSSAVRALANPGDPSHAFAQEFLSTLVGDGLRSQPAPGGAGATAPAPSNTPPALDDDGNLMPGVVDSAATLEQQQAQLQAHLIGQGIDGAQASNMASAHYAAPILIRDEAAREAVQAQQTDAARATIDAFEPGSASELLADAGGSGVPSDAGSETPRWRRLGESLQRLAEADTPFLIERNQAFLKAQVGKYEQLEAQALDTGDTLLARNLASERSLIENTLTRLEARLVEVDYGAAALRYADRLAIKPGSTFSRQDILQATQRFVAGTAITGNAVDDYVRTQMASDDTRLYLTVLGGGSIAALVGQDSSGAGSPRLQRTPNGSVQVPGTGYRYNFDNLGRVENARADLTLGEGTRNADLQRNAGGSDRRTTDDGGHIVGNRFNPPTEEFNLFAQDANFNRGAYRTLEGKWADALAQGQAVKVEWKFYYSGSSVRPDRLDVTYRVGNNTTVTERFRNAPGGGR